MNNADAATPRRPYRQGVRALAAEANHRRIIDAFLARLAADWFDAVTLEQIAAEAGVTVQTVVRRFGGKEGLMIAASEQIESEVNQRREVNPGDFETGVRQLVEDYEILGDLVIRLLGQEERFAAVKKMADFGRAHHRAWISRLFAPWLDPLSSTERTRRVDALVVATDVYVWKLVRRDMGRTQADLRRMMLQMILAVIPEISATNPLKSKGISHA